MKEKVVRILEEKKVEDVSIIDVRTRSALFDYFVIGTIESGRQVDAVIDELKKSSFEIHHIEQTDDNGWVLIDLFDVVIHLFSPDKRAEYNLDSLWKNTVETISENGR